MFHPLNLSLVQQQLPLPGRRVVGPGPLGVHRNVDPVQPGFAVLDLNPAVHERRAPHPEGLHFRPHQGQTGLPRLLDLVVVAGTPVARDHLLRV
ncbi:hypothetical protein SDC9_211558 [bioreactor metagenome]|uniref:Uncharacterized protein n=1 Tax=bioreactor metagenome TaxID=1076179 RepID=A0A645JKL8_9ZZZZ